MLGWTAAVTLVLFAGAVRALGLDLSPPGFWQDEASTGYDAYLLFTTGRDRAGVFLPVIARSFGDYPLALYRYLDAPIVGLFGTSPTTERAVASFFGTAMVIAAALGVRLRLGGACALGVVVTAGLSPMGVHFSRYGSEAILMPSLLTMGWLFFELEARRQKGPRARGGLFWMVSVCLGLSAYTYHAVKLFLPLWSLALLVYAWPTLRARLSQRIERAHVVGSIILFFLLVSPSVWAALTPEGMSRGQSVILLFRVSGRELAYAALNNYLSYFDPGFLYVRGGHLTLLSLPHLGIFSLIELPLHAVGWWALYRMDRRLFGFILTWFLLGPLPGGLSDETQNVGRAIGWLPSPHIVSGVGLMVVARTLAAPFVAVPRRALAMVVAATVGLVGCLGLIATAAHLLDRVFVQYPRYTQHDWQFDIGRSLDCARRVRREGEHIVVSSRIHLASTFAGFYLAPLPLGPRGAPVWSVDHRRALEPGELYVTRSSEPRPSRADIVCIIRRYNDPTPKAYVFRSTAKDADH